MGEAERWVDGILRAGIRPDAQMTVWEWADRYRMLTSKAANEAGPWRTDRVPYMREIMECLSPNHPAREIVVMKGGQIAFTSTCDNFVGYVMDVAPGPMLFYMPTIEMMRDHSRTHVESMIEECPRLASKVLESRKNKDAATVMMKEFPGGFLSLNGAKSAVAFRSKSARYAIADEIDGYPGDVEGEGDPIFLLRRAFRTYPNYKLLLGSTPLIAGTSRIEDLYDQTDSRRFWVPCVHCGEMQTLKWKQISWPDKHPEQATYSCEHCGCVLYNHDKTEMLARGEWRAEVPNWKGKRVGFHLSSLYSPVGWLSWGAIAEQFVEAQKDHTKLKQWVNTVLGETWKEIGEVPEWEKLYNRREKYERNRVPRGGLFLTAGADVQKDRIEVEIVAWGRDKESWSIDYRVYPGDTADLNSTAWRSMDMLLSEGFGHECGLTLPVRVLAIDTGGSRSESGVGYTQTVYNWCRRYDPGRVMPVKGMDSLPLPLGHHPKPVDVYTGAKQQKRLKNALKLWTVGVSHLKGELYSWLRMERADQDDTETGRHGLGTGVPGWCHWPEDYEEEYFRQLCAEQLQAKHLRTGRTIYEWIKLRDRNESLDCRVYARAAAAMLLIDRYQAHHWDRLEESVWGEGSSDTATGRPGDAGPRPGAEENPIRTPGTQERNGITAARTAKYRGRRQLSSGVKG